MLYTPYFLFFATWRKNYFLEHILNETSFRMVDKRTLDKLKTISDQSWVQIYKQLVLYADFKLKKAGFEIRTEKDSVDAEHFACLAIEKVFDGSRKWDFEKYPDIEVHLIAIVKSLISSHFKSSVRSLVQAGGDTQELIEQSGNNDEVAYGTEPSPEEVIINEEKWQAIKDAFADNGNDYVIYCEWLDGLPPREIAEALELPVRDVYNAIRKGTRIVKELFRKQL